MDFDWKPLAGAIIQAGAPVIGGALLGPIGSAAGSMLGGLLASALGVDPTPEAVGNAIQTRDPAAVADALARADSEAVAKWDAIARISIAEAADRTAQGQAVNETMRAEIGKVPWWHWRHQLGNIVAFEIFVFPIAALATIIFGAPEKTRAMIEYSGQLTIILGIASGLLGVVAVNNTTRGAIAVSGEKPENPVLSTVKAIVGKKR